MLQLNQQKQWLGQARLGHADMEANPQELKKKKKISQVAQEKTVCREAQEEEHKLRSWLRASL